MSSAIKLLAIVALILVFQNFSHVGEVQESELPESRVVMPIEAKALDSANYFAQREPASFEPAQPIHCENRDRRAVFLRFLDVRPGTRLVGTLRDADGRHEIAIDAVVGRDSSVGNCDEPGAVSENKLKVCFPEKVGPYFELKLSGGAGGPELSSSFASEVFCESESMVMAVDVKAGALN